MNKQQIDIEAEREGRAIMKQGFHKSAFKAKAHICRAFRPIVTTDKYWQDLLRRCNAN